MWNIYYQGKKIRSYHSALCAQTEMECLIETYYFGAKRAAAREAMRASFGDYPTGKKFYATSDLYAEEK